MTNTKIIFFKKGKMISSHWLTSPVGEGTLPGQKRVGGKAENLGWNLPEQLGPQRYLSSKAI